MKTGTCNMGSLATPVIYTINHKKNNYALLSFLIIAFYRKIIERYPCGTKMMLQNMDLKMLATYKRLLTD
jgi:hypothetical protein